MKMKSVKMSADNPHVLHSRRIVFFAPLLLLTLLCTPHEITAQSFNPDSDYFSFGKILKVERLASLDLENPHQVAQYSIYLFKEGETERVIKGIGHVEKDIELGRSFNTFVREFGPDLERFKGKSLYLKFEGYREGKDTSVWYYLVNARGKRLIRGSWISLHRSKTDGRCALTGIFLNTPDNEISRMPKGLKRSE
jgi:hypothetical protein